MPKTTRLDQALSGDFAGLLYVKLGFSRHWRHAVHCRELRPAVKLPAFGCGDILTKTMRASLWNFRWYFESAHIPGSHLNANVSSKVTWTERHANVDSVCATPLALSVCFCGVDWVSEDIVSVLEANIHSKKDVPDKHARPILPFAAFQRQKFSLDHQCLHTNPIIGRVLHRYPFAGPS